MTESPAAFVRSCLCAVALLALQAAAPTGASAQTTRDQIMGEEPLVAGRVNPLHSVNAGLGFSALLNSPNGLGFRFGAEYHYALVADREGVTGLAVGGGFNLTFQAVGGFDYTILDFYGRVRWDFGIALGDHLLAIGPAVALGYAHWLYKSGPGNGDQGAFLLSPQVDIRFLIGTLRSFFVYVRPSLPFYFGVRTGGVGSSDTTLRYDMIAGAGFRF